MRPCEVSASQVSLIGPASFSPALLVFPPLTEETNPTFSRQVREPGLVADVVQILEDTGWPAELLQLELTESEFMGTTEDTIAVLRDLADIGVRIAIDDFGTGYSNLAYLRRLPVHTLKLAGPFITRGTSGQDETDETDDIDLQIVATVVRLAHILGLSVTAESVETPAQLIRLRRLGCDTGQGWLFAPAVPPKDIPGLVHTPPWSSDPPATMLTGEYRINQPRREPASLGEGLLVLVSSSSRVWDTHIRPYRTIQIQPGGSF